jgi:hypothetical protein
MRQDKRQEVLRAALERLNRTDTRYTCAAHFERLAQNPSHFERYFPNEKRHGTCAIHPSGS